MAETTVTTIEQHWNHFLERDMPPEAPPVQVQMMKQAFAAGAISGLQLAVVSYKGTNPLSSVGKHIEDITALNRNAHG